MTSTTANFGTLTDYATGEHIRPATPAEWRRTADVVNDNLSAGNYSGAFELDGRTVYVDGGPEAEIVAGDVRALRDAAGTAGDSEMVRLCDQALEDDGSQESIEAGQQCFRVILDTRMEMA